MQAYQYVSKAAVTIELVESPLKSVEQQHTQVLGELKTKEFDTTCNQLMSNHTNGLLTRILSTNHVATSSINSLNVYSTRSPLTKRRGCRSLSIRPLLIEQLVNWGVLLNFVRFQQTLPSETMRICLSVYEALVITPERRHLGYISALALHRQSHIPWLLQLSSNSHGQPGVQVLRLTGRYEGP